jgi:hypothetical protein
VNASLAHCVEEKHQRSSQELGFSICFIATEMKRVTQKFLLVACGILSGCATPPADDAYGNDDGKKPPATVDDDGLVWRRANLTTFESYPTSEEECVDFSGCDYAGRFAAVGGKQTLEWVEAHNIIAVHGDDFDTYELKTLRIRDDDGDEIDAVVYDLCSDSDCDGCCTRNSAETGFLIDMESFTAERFGGEPDIVEWACIDC